MMIVAGCHFALFEALRQGQGLMRLRQACYVVAYAPNMHFAKLFQARFVELCFQTYCDHHYH